MIRKEPGRLARYLITLQYVGAGFHGFQKQPFVPTVQGALEQALCTLIGRETPVLGAGRTDAGVHALGQAAAFDIEPGRDVSRIVPGLNALLPRGISVTGMARVRDDMDPRRDALWREYRFFLLNTPAPSALLEDYTVHIHKPLDKTLMSEACSRAVGEHDFSAFRAQGSPEDSGVRRVIECDLEEVWPSVLQFRVRATAFLYRMVRIMAGAVTEVGSGRASLEDLSAWLKGGDRPCAVPLPPQGLFLWKVAYPGELFIDDAGV